MSSWHEWQGKQLRNSHSRTILLAMLRLCIPTVMHMECIHVWD
jgi:hypothetical protein